MCPYPDCDILRIIDSHRQEKLPSRRTGLALLKLMRFLQVLSFISRLYRINDYIRFEQMLPLICFHKTVHGYRQNIHVGTLKILQSYSLYCLNTNNKLFLLQNRIFLLSQSLKSFKTRYLEVRLTRGCSNNFRNTYWSKSFHKYLQCPLNILGNFQRFVKSRVSVILFDSQVAVFIQQLWLPYLVTCRSKHILTLLSKFHLFCLFTSNSIDI